MPHTLENNLLYQRIIIPLLLAINLSVFTSHSAAEERAADLFETYRNKIFQIRLIDKASGKKSALGSGFLVSDDGLIATNYHVLSMAVAKPGVYRIEYESSEGKQGELTLKSLDIIHDLALVKASAIIAPALKLSDKSPAQGETIYSIGNPMDLGMTVIPGTYNGVYEQSYYRRIHFSGSINPGMSGGPTLNKAGEVVGINVSTAGNQVSFLVPVDELQTLLGSHQQKSDEHSDFQALIAQQLHNNQQQLYDQLLALPWETQPLGEAQSLEELKPFSKCWGDSNAGEEDARFFTVSNSCQAMEHVYLQSRFTTGMVNYQFFWLEAGELNSTQFYNYYQSLFGSFVADNPVQEKNATEFSCSEWFVHPDLQPQGCILRQSLQGIPPALRCIVCSRLGKRFT